MNVYLEQGGTCNGLGNQVQFMIQQTDEAQGLMGHSSYSCAYSSKEEAEILSNTSNGILSCTSLMKCCLLTQMFSQAPSTLTHIAHDVATTNHSLNVCAYLLYQPSL